MHVICLAARTRKVPGRKLFCDRMIGQTVYEFESSHPSQAAGSPRAEIRASFAPNNFGAHRLDEKFDLYRLPNRLLGRLEPRQFKTKISFSGLWMVQCLRPASPTREDAIFNMLSANRRDLLIAPLLAAIPGVLLGDRADASPIDPNMTFTKLPDQITWEAARNRPPNTVEQALLWGKSSEPGLYYYLVKWYPGFMSAPHWYETDRLCVVVFRHLVGGERGRLRAKRHGSNAGGQLHPARRAHAALRRRQEGRQGACGDCDLRHRTDHLSRGGSEQTGFARTVSTRPIEPLVFVQVIDPVSGGSA